MFYKSIDECPILNFQRAIETNDLKHLLKEYDKNYKGDLSAVFKKLNDEIIDEFGLTEINQLIFYKTKEIVKLKARKIVEDNESLTTDIQIAEMQLKRLHDKTKVESSIKQLFSSNHRVLTKWSGRDSRQLIVFDYYNDLRDFEKEIEKDAGKDHKK